MASTAVRYITSPNKSLLGSIYIQLHVKPGASKDREGISSVTDTAINLCVSAPPREGEANKAVVVILSDALNVPKSRLQLRRGLKSKDKTAVLDGVGTDGETFASNILEILRKASAA